MLQKLLLLLSFISISAGATLDIGSVTGKICYEFEEKSYLKQSFNVGTPEFRKLELLGDSVLYKTLTEYFHPRLKDANEVHAQREKYKTNQALSKRFIELGLADDLSQVWQSPSGTNASENYAATLEALIGAIQDDGGDTESKNFIYRMYGFTSKSSAKRAKSLRLREPQSLPAKKGKIKTSTEKLNPEAPKSLHDILYLPQKEQVKKYGKQYLNHRYVDVEVDKHKGIYAIEAFRCYHGGVSALELHSVEASSSREAQVMLASWALENLDEFSESSFMRGMAKSNLIAGRDFLTNMTYSLFHLSAANKKIREKDPDRQHKTYCRHRYKKVGGDTYAIELYPHYYPSYTKEIYRLKIADEVEANKALAEWTLEHLDLFMIDDDFFHNDKFFSDNGFVKMESRVA